MRPRLFVTLIAVLAVAATFCLNLQRVHAGQEQDASEPEDGAHDGPAGQSAAHDPCGAP